MSELQTIFLTSGLTIIGGTILLIISQVFTRFFIEPIHEQRKIINEISDTLGFYANVYSNPGTAPIEILNEASQELRQKATLLRSRTSAIPWYKFFSFMLLVKPISNIEDASSSLIGISNSVYEGSDPIINSERSKIIKDSLDIML